MNRRKLPIGIQTFAKLREGDCYYVDKTPQILQLIEGGTHYFLSRPRRFGKSLLVDTLHELFEGNEGLFRGLYIHDSWDWSVRFPVIRLSFGGGVLKKGQDLAGKLEELMRDNAHRLGLSCRYGYEDRRCFAELLRLAHEKFGQRAVVLVDEYDKPILDNITDTATARMMRDGLRDFYSVIKDSDAHVRFAFLTGVSKFSKVSQIYLFEFKVVEDSPVGGALAQIKARDYAAKYRSRGEPIHLVGVEFSRQSRNIVGFEVERD